MSFIAPLLLVVTLMSLSCFLVVGLISIPWPCLLVLLLVGLFLTQRVLRMSSLESTLELNQAPDSGFRD